jgi:hypothetical protein
VKSPSQRIPVWRTSNAGLIAYRELDDALGLTDLAGGVLSDGRRGKNTRHLLTGLFRQSVLGRLAGYEDVNDADRLAHDPAMRAIVDRAGLERGAASTSQDVARRAKRCLSFTKGRRNRGPSGECRQRPHPGNSNTIRDGTLPAAIDTWRG